MARQRKSVSPNKSKSTPPKNAVVKRKNAPSRFNFTTEQVIIGGTILFTILVVGAVIFNSARNQQIQNQEIEDVEAFANPGGGHTESPVSYPQTPPIGGQHHPVWQQCGVYTEPIIDEHAVHSLEHGAVWITYQPDLPADQVERLQALTRRSTHRLLSPYPGQDSPIILTAWGYQLRLESADDDRLTAFIQKYEQGPQTPEFGATCSGGENRTASQLGLG
jgi:hypothetical protein